MIRLEVKCPKFTIYSVSNFEKYRSSSPESRQNLAGISPEIDHHGDQQESQSGQGVMDLGDQQNDHQVTSRRPSSDQQTTTQEQSKQRKQRKKDNKIHYAEFVKFTEDEYQKLKEKYGEDMNNRCIEFLNTYKGANGKKYESDYMAILNWVAGRVLEDIERERRSHNVTPFKRQGQRQREPLAVVDPSGGKTLTAEQRAEARRKAAELDAYNKNRDAAH
ncbi:hypothetical protein WMW72_10740 [Paenibacillus filicis]|uniref:Uncharacterized protein n=1 Tax=Paenibacillus filicis TaxID=669464 RepID=A0ABU9DHQ3_9BACL